MITVRQSRDKRYRDGSIEHFEQATLTFDDSFKALSHLVESELAWGGKIVRLNDSLIEVKTEIFGDIDTLIFEGEADEIALLVEFSAYYIQGMSDYYDIIVDQAVTDFDKIGGVYAGTPLLLSFAAPFLTGNNCLRVAIMLACGIRDESEIRRGTFVPMSHLVAALELARNGECSFLDALYL